MKSLLWTILIIIPVFLWQTIILQYQHGGSSIFEDFFYLLSKGEVFNDYLTVATSVVNLLIFVAFVLAIIAGIKQSTRIAYGVVFTYLFTWLWVCIEMRFSPMNFDLFITTSTFYLTYISALLIALIIIGIKQRKNLKTS